ncbi:hypothetical protein K504DRAFT_27099 [Pleomassaria siparia CBS 279.74]|uniref:Uncharacterized protein n=1 Tax=Pleomassaria siparia CBS 279.74 TaxID=1314801 RepID=A0A6G1KRG2_9PLEO|nr:hypothetical protein K504DRAFT_27099 [Pleomassaria siparia CBS 279.74]
MNAWESCQDGCRIMFAGNRLACPRASGQEAYRYRYASYVFLSFAPMVTTVGILCLRKMERSSRGMTGEDLHIVKVGKGSMIGFSSKLQKVSRYGMPIHARIQCNAILCSVQSWTMQTRKMTPNEREKKTATYARVAQKEYVQVFESKVPSQSTSI